MLIEGGPVRSVSLGAWLGTVLLAAMSLASFFSYYKGLAKVSVSTASVIESFTPVITLVISAIFLGEALSGGRLVGAAFVLLGTVLVSFTEGFEPGPAPVPVGD
jgi:drug/metabolite transporter (DMT)-like permease